MFLPALNFGLHSDLSNLNFLHCLVTALSYTDLDGIYGRVLFLSSYGALGREMECDLSADPLVPRVLLLAQ